MSLTLDDLRQPGFGARVWGYDRDEVDQLLASVVVSIERLQRRRQRDGEAIDRATTDARKATERAEAAERERDELASRVDLADEAVAGALREAQRMVADAEGRAEHAEEAFQALKARSRGRAATAGNGVQDEGAGRPGDPGPGSEGLPLALRAARALLAEARQQAGTIEADALRRAESATSRRRGSDGPSPSADASLQ